MNSYKLSVVTLALELEAKTDCKPYANHWYSAGKSHHPRSQGYHS